MNNTIYFVAMIKMLWDDNHTDVIEIFVYLLSTVIAKHNINQIHNTEEGYADIIDKFFKEFNFNIPYEPLISIIIRMKKKGILDKSQNIYHVKKNILEIYTLQIDSNITNKHFDTLISDFIKFSEDEYSIKIEKKDVENVILKVLKNNLESILFAIKEDYKLDDEFHISNSKMTKRDEYIFSKYIVHIYNNNFDFYLIILNYVFGYLLAHTITYDSNSLGTKTMKNIHIYFDSKIIFRLLGTEGDFYRNETSTFIDKLNAYGFNLHVFKHNYNEVKNILDSSIDVLRYQNTKDFRIEKSNNVVKHFYYNNMSESDIEFFISSLDGILDNNNINIIDSPDLENINNYKYHIDSELLKEMIIEKYNKTQETISEQKDYSIDIDVKSISSIIILWKNTISSSIDNVNHLFITANYSLANASKEYCFYHFKNVRRVIPPAITEIFLGTFLWVRDPLFGDELINQRLISRFSAILKPNTKLLERYLNQITKLKETNEITNEQYILLKSSFVVNNMLVEKTFARAEFLEESTPMDILSDIEDKAHLKYIDEKQKNIELVNDKKRIEIENTNLSDENKNLIKKDKKITWAAILGPIFAALITGLIAIRGNKIDKEYNIKNELYELVSDLKESINNSYVYCDTNNMLYELVMISNIDNVITYYDRYSNYLSKYYDSICDISNSITEYIYLLKAENTNRIANYLVQSNLIYIDKVEFINTKIDSLKSDLYKDI